MRKTCGLTVVSLGTNRGWLVYYPQQWISLAIQRMENYQDIRTLHNFYTQFFTYVNLIFQSVIFGFYTLYTRLIITKTIYI